MSAWTPDRRFAGQTVAVIAGGPSATPEAIASVSRYAKVVVRESWRLCPIQHGVLLSLDGDREWFRLARDVGGFLGLALTGNPDAGANELDFRYIGLRYERVRIDANTEVEIRNSGIAAVRVAAEMGATEILLVGFDMSRGYALGYVPGVQKPGERPYGYAPEALAALIAELAAQGVTVRHVEKAPEIRATANDPASDVPTQPQPAEAATEESERPTRREPYVMGGEAAERWREQYRR